MKSPTLYLGIAAVATGLCLPGCGPRADAPPAKKIDVDRPMEAVNIEQRVLTAEEGKAAILELMRTRPEVLTQRFNIDEWSKVELAKGEDGGYHFGGSFRIQPKKAIYTQTVRPAPGAKACTFVFQGSFTLEAGGWIAQPPSELLSSALGIGN